MWNSKQITGKCDYKLEALKKVGYHAGCKWIKANQAYNMIWRHSREKYEKNKINETNGTENIGNEITATTIKI